MIAVIQSRKAERRRRKISASHDRLHDNVQGQFRRAYRAWLNRVVRDIVDRLESGGSTNVTADDLFQPASHSRAFSRRLLPMFNLAIWSGVGFEADWIDSQEAKQSLSLMRQELELPDDFEPPPSIDVSPSPTLLGRVDTHMQQRQVGLWNQVTETTRNRLNHTIRKGLEEGDDLDGMTARVRREMGHYSDMQARRVARTETTSGMNWGQQAERDDLGIENKEWVSTIDSRNRGADATSPFDHLAPDGQTVPNNQPFVVSGENVMFPGDSSMGASAGNTINCRCTSVAAFDDSPTPPPRPTRRRPKPKPKRPTETPPTPKPNVPEPEPPPDPLAKKPAHLGFSGEANEFSERVWEEIGPDGIKDEAHSRRVGKVIREEVENHPAVLEAKRTAEETRKRLEEAEAEAERLRKALIDAETDEEAGKLFVKSEKADRERERLGFRLEEANLEVQQSFATAAKETLPQVRDMGIDFDDFRKRAKPDMGSGTVRAAEEAMGDLPADWGESIASWAEPTIFNGGPVKIRKVKRGYFSQGERKIYISGNNQDDFVSTMRHELAHAAESTHKVNGEKKLPILQKEFLERRAKGEKPKKIIEGEFGFEDEFQSHYSGKIYGTDTNFEILSTGVESVFNPAASLRKGYNYWEDADYMEFILGLLAGI